MSYLFRWEIEGQLAAIVPCVCVRWQW
jgi:hypothetical protein